MALENTHNKRAYQPGINEAIKMPRQVESCYMCDQPATTREHVPPKSFFPKNKRANIWTVPSCAHHNFDNHLDVEYVRNIISIHLGSNVAAEETLESAKRSWQRSPALFRGTFDDIAPVIVQNQEVGAFSCELRRVKSVMSAVAQALAYLEFGRFYVGEWRIVCASFASRTPTPNWDNLRSVLAGFVYQPVPSPQPEVFQLGVQRMQPPGLIYRMVFYEACIVFAWPAT